MLPLLAQAGAGLLGGMFGNSALANTKGDIMGLTDYQPMTTGSNFGNFRFGQNGNAMVTDSGSQADMRSMLQGLQQYGFGGGLFNDPSLQAGMNASNLGGAMNQLTATSQMMANPQAFSQMGQIGGLTNQLMGQIGNGPQDLTGGMQNSLFGMGLNNMNAGFDNGLYNDQLRVMREAAEPVQNRMYNKLENRLFAQGRLGSTGGSENMEGLFNSFNQQDLGFQNAAFDRAMQQGAQNQNVGLQQMQQGLGLFGQNLGQFNTGVNNVSNLLGMGAGLENQLFQNQFNTIGQAQTAGQNRLQGALNLFGLGSGTQTQAFQNALQAAQGQQGIDQLQQTGLLGLLNAEANRIGATAGHASAIGGLGQSQGGLMGGIFSGIGDAIGGFFG